MIKVWRVLSVLFFLVTMMVWSSGALACTGIQLNTQDHVFINGRTVEFGVPLDLSGLVIPRNYHFQGTLPDGTSNGLKYSAKYAVVGASAFNQAAILDGVNEKGLAAGAFYFPGYANYAVVTEDNRTRALAPTEFVNWVLTQFATVDEVKNAIQSVVIVPYGTKDWGGAPPFHYVVYDVSGKSIVIEPLKGQLIVYDNPVGVITNSPTFDWHLTNLSNYMSLSPMNIPNKLIGNYELRQFGEGNGLLGMPGDFTPPSRFIRAVIFSASAIPATSVQDAVFNMFHILNQFDIPVGAVRGENDGKLAYDTTIATTVKDGASSKYYFKTYDNQSIRVIDLNAFDKNGTRLMNILFKGEQSVTDVSKMAKPH